MTAVKEDYPTSLKHHRRSFHRSQKVVAAAGVEEGELGASTSLQSHPHHQVEPLLGSAVEAVAEEAAVGVVAAAFGPVGRVLSAFQAPSSLPRNRTDSRVCRQTRKETTKNQKTIFNNSRFFLGVLSLPGGRTASRRHSRRSKISSDPCRPHDFAP